MLTVVVELNEEQFVKKRLGGSSEIQAETPASGSDGSGSGARAGVILEEAAAQLVARGVGGVLAVFDLTVRQIESLHEALARSDVEQRAPFIEDLATGIGCITSEGTKALETVFPALRARAEGDSARRPSTWLLALATQPPLRSSSSVSWSVVVTPTCTAVACSSLSSTSCTTN